MIYLTDMNFRGAWEKILHEIKPGPNPRAMLPENRATRRKGLEMAAKGTAAFVAANVIHEVTRGMVGDRGEVEAQSTLLSPEQISSTISLKEIIDSIEGSSVQERIDHLLHAYPISPDWRDPSLRNSLLDIFGRAQDSTGTFVKLGSSVIFHLFSATLGTENGFVNLGDDPRYARIQQFLDNEVERLGYPQQENFGTRAGMGIYGLEDPMFCDGNSMNILGGEKVFIDPNLPLQCVPGKSIVDSLITTQKPLGVFVCLGTNEISISNFGKMSLAEFARIMESEIQKLVANGIVPFIMTLPEDLEGTDPSFKMYADGDTANGTNPAHLPENATKYNMVICMLAKKYNVPLLNILRNCHVNVTNHGIEVEDPIHLSGQYTVDEQGVLHWKSRLSIPEHDEQNYGVAATELQCLESMANLLDTAQELGFQFHLPDDLAYMHG